MATPVSPQNRARELRRSQTDAERALWLLLRARRFDGIKFRRQVPIGPFIADFATLERKLVVELDGGQHLESESDRKRDSYLAENGYRVLRFWNHEILGDPDSVLARIRGALKQR
jgi:very-short-patch-repair endonuclease